MSIVKIFGLFKNLKKYQQDWYEENAPLGHGLGYPECCIKAFCNQPPQLLEILGVNDNDRLRYKAACIDGKFTGFIPCTIHAKEILSGKITLVSLLKNRKSHFPEFPLFGNHE